MKQHLRLAVCAASGAAIATAICYTRPLDAGSAAISTQPARVHPSTPLGQSVFTLLGAPSGIDPKVNYGSGSQAVKAARVARVAKTGLRIRVSWLPPARQVQYSRDSFSVLARASTGDAFALAWRNETHGQERRILVSTPPAYPDAYKYLDVTIKDKKGNSARWRMINLPRMRRLIPRPVKVRDTFKAHGLTVKAAATLYRDSASSGPPSQLVRCNVWPAGGKPTGLYKWSVGRMSNSGWAYPELVPFTGTGGVPYEYAYETQIGSFVRLEYPAYNRYVRLHAALQQYDTWKEKVTFRHLKVKRMQGSNYLVVTRPQSVTTPSGITLTLPKQNFGTSRPDIGYTVGTDRSRLSFLIKWSPGNGSKSLLRRSPLYKRHKKSVRFHIGNRAWPFPIASMGTDVRRPNQCYITLRLPKLPVEHIENLTLTVDQQADLKRIPMTFTVPVTNEKPKKMALIR